MTSSSAVHLRMHWSTTYENRSTFSAFIIKKTVWVFFMTFNVHSNLFRYIRLGSADFTIATSAVLFTKH